MSQVNLGKLTKHPDGYQVKLERVFHHPVEKVWKALTDTEVLRIWFTDIQMDFKVGGKIRIILPSHLAYSIRTRSPRIPPNSILVFEIEVVDAKPSQ